MFKVKFDAGVNYYKFMLADGYNNNLTNFHYSAHIEFYNKNFSAAVGWRKPTKTLSGEFVVKGENNSYINVSYKIKNLTIGAAVYYPFSSGSNYHTDRLSNSYRKNGEIVIKDNKNMFVLGLVYNMNWGKSLFNIRRARNNVEFNNPIMQIKDN